MELRSSIIPIYNSLTLASRQVYVDVVGGGLLYANTHFAFHSPDSMIRYLECINPAHCAMIRSMSVGMTLNASSHSLPLKMLPLLGAMASLEELKMSFRVSKTVCLQQPPLMWAIPQPWGVSAWSLVRLGDATWGDIKGLKTFSVDFVVAGELFDLDTTHESLRGFEKKVKEIVISDA